MLRGGRDVWLSAGIYIKNNVHRPESAGESSGVRRHGLASWVHVGVFFKTSKYKKQTLAPWAFRFRRQMMPNLEPTGEDLWS